MRLDRLGAAHPTRLSFLRTLLRRIARERWRVSWDWSGLDAAGYGHAVATVGAPAGTLSLVAFSTPLEDASRTDRVIAEAWDSSYALYDGVPDAAEIKRLRCTVPRQEAARYSPRDLVLSRANKSVRIFERVVAALARGCQPDAGELGAVGYLMRTTAVYGNGKFGIADRDRIAARADLAGPFQAEMLTVWLIRAFTVALAERRARALAPATAVRLAPDLARSLGVGNATGLGMAPFLVRHPLLIHRWFAARETALARVRSLDRAGTRAKEGFAAALESARASALSWVTDDTVQMSRILALRADLDRLADAWPRLAADPSALWDRTYRFAEASLTLEGQEMTVALLLEPHGALVDDLAEELAADEDAEFALDGGMTCGALAGLIAREYAWARGIDFAAPSSRARFWYVSEEKLEPRLGERFTEPGAEIEQPLATARDILALAGALEQLHVETTVGRFLANQPEHRHATRRVQLIARHPYGEVRGNLIGAALRPIDLLRAKLAYFGASRFDPRSDRWLRICLFAGAPRPEDIAASGEP
jgi:hypothetical protein